MEETSRSAAPDAAQVPAAEPPAEGAAARRPAEDAEHAGLERLERDVLAERERLADEQDRTRQERMRLVTEDQVRRIAELDGEIRSLDDLLNMPEYDAFYALVKKGVSLVEAYKLTRYDRLMQRAADAAARQTMRSISSRQHMTALAGQPGAGEYVSVPAEIAAEYRLAKPGITDAEIRRKYRKYQKYKRQ